MLAVGAVVSVGVEPKGAVVDCEASVGVVLLRIEKAIVPLPAETPSGELTNQETTQSPFGSGFGTVTDNVTPSRPTCGVPTANGEPLHTTSTVLVAPRGLAKVNS